jgi:hypothetical protein
MRVSAKMVVVAKWKISPEPNEVVVSVVQRGRPMQISIDPSFLIPWTPVEGNKIIVVGPCCTRQVGKVDRPSDSIAELAK